MLLFTSMLFCSALVQQFRKLYLDGTLELSVLHATDTAKHISVLLEDECFCKLVHKQLIMYLLSLFTLFDKAR